MVIIILLVFFGYTDDYDLIHRMLCYRSQKYCSIITVVIPSWYIWQVYFSRQLCNLCILFGCIVVVPLLFSSESKSWNEKKMCNLCSSWNYLFKQISSLPKKSAIKRSVSHFTNAEYTYFKYYEQDKKSWKMRFTCKTKINALYFVFAYSNTCVSNESQIRLIKLLKISIRTASKIHPVHKCNEFKKKKKTYRHGQSSVVYLKKKTNFEKRNRRANNFYLIFSALNDGIINLICICLSSTLFDHSSIARH